MTRFYTLIGGSAEESIAFHGTDHGAHAPAHYPLTTMLWNPKSLNCSEVVPPKNSCACRSLRDTLFGPHELGNLILAVYRVWGSENTKSQAIRVTEI